MMDIAAFLVTIIIGPVAFVIWSRVVYRKRNTYKWPVGLADSIGDGLFLPAFNGFAFSLGLAFVFERLTLAILSALVISFFYYRIARRTPANWSKTDDSRLNFGGWYHLIFLTVQSGIIIYALLTHPYSLVLWMSLLAFALTLVYFFAVQLPRRRPHS